MNPGALLAPSAARALPEKSKERALALLSLRQLWHLLFDPCPGLRRAFPDDKDLFEPFLEHARCLGFSMQWPLHAQLLAWIESSNPDRISPELAQELLAAAAARWANADQSRDKGLLLVFHGASARLAVAAWKSRSCQTDHRVVLVEIGGQLPPPAGIHFRAFPDYRYEGGSDWTALPR